MPYKKWKQSVRLSWVASYAVLLAVPMLVFALVSWSTSRIMEDQLADFSTTLVDLMGKEIDGTLNYASRLMTDLTWSPLTLGLMYRDDDSDINTKYDLVRLSDEMVRFTGYSRYIDFAFVYFPNLDRFLLPKSLSTFEQFHDAYFAGTSWSAPSLRAMLSAHHANDSLPFEYITDFQRQALPSVVLLSTLPGSSDSSPAAVIGVVISNDSLVKSLHAAVRTSSSEIRILNDRGDELVSTLGDDGLAAVHLPAPQGTGTAISSGIPVGNQSVTVLQRRTRQFGWTVQLIVPDSVIRERLLSVQFLVLAGVLASVVLGAILTIYLLRRNYRPVSRIVQGLARDIAEPEFGGDEFGLIERSLAHANDQVAKARDRFETHKTVLRHTMAGRLVRGEFDTGLELAESLAALDMVFPGNDFLILLVLYEDLRSQESRPAHSLRDHIENEIRDRLSSHAQVFRTSDPEPLTFLLCLHNATEDCLSSGIPDQLMVSGKALEARHGLSVMCALSSLISGTSRLPTGLRQAQAALEYRFVVGGQRPLTWDELEPSRAVSPCQLDQKDQARLVALVKEGNTVEAQALTDQILAVMASPDTLRPSPQAMKLLVWDLAATVLRGLAEIADGDDGYADLLGPLARLAENPQIEKAGPGMRAIIDDACAWAKEHRKIHQTILRSQANQRFIRQVETWLRDNFRDPSLSLARIAEVHRLSPSYLSRMFKENRDEGLLEHLNRLRIDHAKILIGTTGDNLDQIARQCGFVDLRTFMRVFKKVTGLTPGKFRQLP